MVDDVFTGRSGVLEAHGGHQINEESIASCSEQCILTEETPKDQKSTSSIRLTDIWFTPRMITIKV